MKTMKKKGFTLVELLVVIAIIAILATVSIVGYTTFINKANQAADQQAVTQMNTVLEAAQVEKSLVVANDDASTAVNIFTTLLANGYSDELVAYYDKYDFAYVIDGGKAYIVLIEANKVAYPEKYAGQTDYKTFFQDVSNSEDLEAALNTGYVLLKTDSTFSSELKLTNNVVIVGDNKTLTDNVTVNTDTGSNSIVRVSDLDKEVTIRMDGVNLINPDGSYGRAIHIGKNTEKVTIIMENMTISANHYGFNIAGNNKEVVVVMKNCTLEGYAALQSWSKCNVTLENCTIIGDDISTSATETFGAITLYGGEIAANDSNLLEGYKDAAKDSVLTFKNCTFKMAENTTGYYFFNSHTDATINLEGCTFMVGETVVEWNAETFFNKVSEDITVTFNVK